MKTIYFGNGRAELDLARGLLTSLSLGEQSIIADSAPLFTMGLRDDAGSVILLDATKAFSSTLTEDGARYDFDAGLSLTLSTRVDGKRLVWYAEADNCSSLLLE